MAKVATLDLRTAGTRTLGAAVVATEATLSVVTNTAEALSSVSSIARIKAQDMEHSARVESAYRRESLELEAMQKAAIKHARAKNTIRSEISNNPEMANDYKEALTLFGKIDVSKI